MCVLCIFCHWIEIKLIMMVLSEELLFYLFFMRSLFCFFLQNPLNFILIGIILVNVPFIVRAKFIHTSMKVTGWDYISLIVLTHSHFIYCNLFTIFISYENSQFYCFTKLYFSILEIKKLSAYPSCVHTTEYGKIEHLQSSRIILNVLMNWEENRQILKVMLV